MSCGRPGCACGDENGSGGHRHEGGEHRCGGDHTSGSHDGCRCGHRHDDEAGPDAASTPDPAAGPADLHG